MQHFSHCARVLMDMPRQRHPHSLLVIQFCYFLFWLNTFFLSRAPLDDGGEVSSFRLATGNCQEMGIGTSLLTKVWWRLLIIVINSVVRKTNRFA